MSGPLYRLRAPPQIVTIIRILHPQIKRKVRTALASILAKPHSGKALKDDLAGLRSFRVSRFRIVYRIRAGRLIEIIAVAPRDRIYEETYRLIARNHA
jgi:mRNA interferase RelE/StbE